MKILIQCSTQSHAQAAEAIIEELNKIEKNEIVALSLRNYYGYGPDDYIKNLEWPLCILKRIRKKPKDFNIQDYFQFIFQFRSILKNFNPDILLLGDDHPPLQVAMIEESKRKKIPSILVQEGPFNPSIILNHVDPRQERNDKKNLKKRIKSVLSPLPHSNGYGHGNATVFAVMSEYYRHLWEKAGINSNSIVVTGQPRFDKLFRIRESDKNVQFIKKKEILILSQPLTRYCEYGIWEEEDYRNLLKVFNDSAKRLSPEYKFNIRLHPNESIEDYSSWWNEICTHLNVLSSNGDLYSQILNSSAIVTVFSTAAFEAAILGRPIVTVRDINKYPAIWDTIPNISINIRTVDALVSAILQIHTDESKLEKIWTAQKELIQKELAPFDGKSSNRVAKSILTFKKSRY